MIELRRVITCDAKDCPSELYLKGGTRTTADIRKEGIEQGWFISHDLDPLERHFCPNHKPTETPSELIKGVSEEELK